jgi:UDP-2,4-diacetamido-2,4,6-trideoxy-beta-L-altropyranose hydrolase
VSPGTLLIRADANVAIGTGHVMRCLALAQAWQDSGGRCIFAMAEITSALEQRLRDEGMEVQHVATDLGSDGDATETASIARRAGADWITVDGYHFGSKYQSILKNSDCRVLFLDDNGHAEHYSADLVLNQNPHAQEGLYASREDYTQLLLGPRFVMLRREFKPWRKWERTIPEFGRRILITMGGSDPDNLTLPAVGAFKNEITRDLEATVVVGGSNPHSSLLESEIAEGTGSIRLEQNVTDMPGLMASADIALSAAGGTLWELLFMGCSVLSYARDSAQGKIISLFDAEGVVQDLGNSRTIDPCSLAEATMELARSQERRERMSALGRERVDGRGAGRICECLMTHAARNLQS